MEAIDDSILAAPDQAGFDDRNGKALADMLMPYFGRWPEWINLFMVTCGANKNIHWRFITDCGPPEHRPANTEFHQISFDDYKRLLSRKLGFLFDHDAYKANELRVALGYVYETDIREFEFYGYGDVDVVWGDIDSFYLPLRAEYDFITTVSDLVAGHFSIFRNTDQLRRAFMRTPGYPDLLQVPGQTSFEEVNFARTFKESAHWTSDPPRALFRNQYATVLSLRGWHDGTLNYPQEWHWRDGHITNNADGSREFLYLHFMRWKSLRHTLPTLAENEGAWLNLPSLVHIDWREAMANGFNISPRGFGPIVQ